MTYQIGYNDLAFSLRSRVPRLAQNSAKAGFQIPITTTAIDTYENIAQEVTTLTENVPFDTNQVKTVEDEKTSLTDYDNFSSLRLRLATQVVSSVAGLETIDKAVTTDSEHFALEEMMVTQITAYDPGGANQVNTSV